MCSNSGTRMPAGSMACSSAAVYFTWLLFLGALPAAVHSADPSFDFPPVGGAIETVEENVATGTSVYTLIITDADGDVPTFSIASQVPATPEFTLSSNSIVNTPDVGLDAETSTSFNITFSVTDGQTNVTSSPLMIYVTDVNEFSPEFTLPTYTAVVRETDPNGTIVTTVTAEDGDVTAEISYSFLRPQTTFSISRTTGDVTLVAPGDLDVTVTPSYTLTIQASDGTNTDVTNLTIDVKGDPCQPNPCQHSGHCTTSANSYVCSCTSGWVGDNCTTANPCSSNPCENNGSCSISGTTFLCACASGWIGNTCSVEFPCYSNPCMHDGECTVTNSTHACLCTSGWTGSDCSIEDPCFTNPCKNNGSCTRHGMTYVCTCADEWTGPSCEIENTCHSNPCLNNGKCVISNSTHACICSSGWTGSECSIEDTCITSPCKNNGSCTRHGSSYVCTCADEWTGPSCEIDDPCQPNPCEHGGTCVISGTAQECICADKWTGSNCSIEDPCFTNPCQHNGSCTRHGSSYICTCADAWTGPSCEIVNPCQPNPCQNGSECFISGSSHLCNDSSGTEKDGESSAVDVTEIIIAVTASIALIGVVGIVLMGFSYHKRHKMKAYDLDKSRPNNPPVSPISL